MLTVSTFILLHEKNNLASQFFVIISYYRFTYEIHKHLYVYPRAMHIIYTAWLFSTIGFTQSLNMYKTTDTDCLPIWQISARYRYRLSVNHYSSRGLFKPGLIFARINGSNIGLDWTWKFHIRSTLNEYKIKFKWIYLKNFFQIAFKFSEI